MDAAEPVYADVTPASITRVEVICRSVTCKQKLSLPIGHSGHVACPRCGRRAWYTTEQQSVLVRNLRMLVHNQERVAASAMVLLILALVWISAAWSYRGTSPFAIYIAAGGAAISAALLSVFLRRPGLDNILVGALKETRTFFIVLAACCGVFVVLSLYRYGFGDPLKASHTLLQLERMRDREGGEIVAFLKSSGWKYGLLIAGFIALVSPFLALRRALAGSVKHGSKAARIVVYALTALSAFTFGGALHDAELSRVAPKLKGWQETIEGGYEKFEAAQRQAAIEVLVDELFGSLDPLTDSDDLDDSSGAPKLPSSDAPTDPSPDAGPSGVPPRSPGPNGGPGSEGPRKRLLTEWRDSLNREMGKLRSTTDRAADLARSEQRATESPASRRASELNVAKVQELQTRPLPSTSVTAADVAKMQPWDAETRAFVRSTVSAALAGRIPEATTALESLSETHPFREHLKTLTGQLGDGVVQGVIKDVLMEAVEGAYKDAKFDLRDWMRKRISALTAGESLRRVKSAVADFRKAVALTFRDIQRGPAKPGPQFAQARAAMTVEFGAEWQKALERLPDRVRGSAVARYSAVRAGIEAAEPYASALQVTEKTKSLRGSGLSGYREPADLMAKAERQFASTSEIQRQIDAEEQAREDARKQMAERKAKWDRLFSARDPEVKRPSETDDTRGAESNYCPAGTVPCTCGGVPIGCVSAAICVRGAPCN